MKFPWVLLPILLFGMSRAQPTTSAKRILGSALIQGYIGGESHDACVIKATKGQTLTLQLGWKSEAQNKASLKISQSASFFRLNQFILDDSRVTKNAGLEKSLFRVITLCLWWCIQVLSIAFG